MKYLVILLCLFAMACNAQKEKERNIRKSINKYLRTIEVSKDTRKNYSILFKEYSEADFISYLRKENLESCESSIAERSATILEHRKKFEAGLPLTPQEQEYDTIKPKNVFSKIDDSLSSIHPDPSKIYYRVFAFQLQGRDTVWKNNFWLDEHYKIVW